MLRYVKLLDQNIPLWEILVIILALLAIAVILILWWAFGYNLVVVTERAPTMEAVALAASLL